MKSHKWLSHAITRVSRPVRNTPGKPSTGRARVWATRGILVMALVLGGVGAVVAALSSHGSVGHVSSVRIMHVPWMY